MRDGRTSGRGRRNAGFAIVVLAALSGLAACKPAPKAGTIDIVGDSLTVQSYWLRDEPFDAGAPAGSDIVKDAWLGNRFQDVAVAEADRVAKERPAILVIALGTNNARSLDKSWDAEDEAAFKKLLDAPHTAACVVVVLPGYSDKATVPDKDRSGLDKGRKAMRALADKRKAAGSPTVVVDWGAEALAHPELTRDDGIHLADDALAAPDRLANEEAADAWSAVMWRGVAACQKGAVPKA